MLLFIHQITGLKTLQKTFPSPLSRYEYTAVYTYAIQLLTVVLICNYYRFSHYVHTIFLEKLTVAWLLNKLPALY